MDVKNHLIKYILLLKKKLISCKTNRNYYKKGFQEKDSTISVCLIKNCRFKSNIQTNFNQLWSTFNFEMLFQRLSRKRTENNILFVQLSKLEQQPQTLHCLANRTSLFLHHILEVWSKYDSELKKKIVWHSNWRDSFANMSKIWNKKIYLNSWRNFGRRFFPRVVAPV